MKRKKTRGHISRYVIITWHSDVLKYTCKGIGFGMVLLAREKIMYVLEHTLVPKVLMSI